MFTEVLAKLKIYDKEKSIKQLNLRTDLKNRLFNIHHSIVHCERIYIHIKKTFPNINDVPKMNEKCMLDVIGKITNNEEYQIICDNFLKIETFILDCFDINKEISKEKYINNLTKIKEIFINLTNSNDYYEIDLYLKQLKEQIKNLIKILN